ncbi:MAG: flippase-like domain-containing protein [Gemmatimonadota bacterium]|nr:flippase-like domain-containing protein [Gemmatimonadota bacterium]
MAKKLAPQLMRRGLEIFAVISLIMFAAVLFYGNNLGQFVTAMVNLRWGWVLLGVGVASLDWFGGGLRLYVLARHVYPATSIKGAVLSAGLNSYAMMLTPSQAGGGPLGIYTLKRYGTPIPEGMVATFMSFVATILFFAAAGPAVVFLGAGDTLEEHGILGVATLNDLFRLSLGGFIVLGAVLLALIIFPDVARRIARRIVSWLERRGNPKMAHRISGLNEGIDRAHGAMVAFFRGRGWISLAGGVLLTGPTLANKLLAGYIVLRALDIHAPFVDVVMLQTLIIFLLYFAPTPGGSGLAEVLSGGVMSIFVPRELTPSYILLWRIYVAYLTVAAGSFVFWRWLKLWEEEGDNTSDEAASTTPL